MKRTLKIPSHNRKPLISVLAFTLTFCLFLGFSQLLTRTIFFIEGRELILSQNRKQIEKQISLYFKQLELELRMVEQLQNDLITGPDVVYLNLGPYSPFEENVATAVERLITQMIAIRSGNRYIEKFDLHFQNPKRTLCADRICYARFDPNHIRELQTAPGERFKFLNGNLCMVAFPSSATKENFICCSEIVFDSDLIASELKNFLFSEDSYSILSFAEYEYTISSVSDLPDSISAIEPTGMRSITLNGISYIPVEYISDFFHAKYVQLIPEEKMLMEVNHLLFFLLAFFALVFLLAVFYFVLLHRLINHPVKELEKAIFKIQGGNFSARLSNARIREFSNIYDGFNEMAKSLSHLIEDVYEQKVLIQKAELYQLQAQINPHFLYNSFFILKIRIAAKKYEDASHFADMLGTYFKFIVKSNTGATSLEEELAHAKIYASIQAARFKNRIQVSWGDVPKEFGQLQVPSLILQPILENAFKYGLEDMEFDGLLKFEFCIDNTYLYFFIKDNSEGFERNRHKISTLQQALDEGTPSAEPSALLNIHRRLQLFFKDPQCGLSLKQGTSGGPKITVKLRKDNHPQ